MPRRTLTAAGLAIEVDETVTIHEPEGDATFLWPGSRAQAARWPTRDPAAFR